MQVMYIILLALSNTVINVPNPINPMNGPSALLLGAFNNYVDKKREGGVSRSSTGGQMTKLGKIWSK